MALIKCPECNQEVSDKAKACPKCAFPIAEENKKKDEESKNNNETVEKENNRTIEEKSNTVICEQCKTIINKDASVCPNCQSDKTGCAAIGAIILFLFFGYMFISHIIPDIISNFFPL